jgi:hypothetical protein
MTVFLRDYFLFDPFQESLVPDSATRQLLQVNYYRARFSLRTGYQAGFNSGSPDLPEYCALLFSASDACRRQPRSALQPTTT